MNHKAKYKVTFIIPYIGSRVPPYLNLFFHSCSYNSDYQFLFFTNLDINCEIPPNVKLIRISKNAIEKLILAKTGINANLNRFYKICDFKPAFGEIFSDYLINAEFWGHTDIDLILGNLNEFLNPLLLKYDVLSFRSEYHSGSFAIYRNISKVNFLFRNVKNYERTLEDTKHHAFDEASRLRSGENIYQYLLKGKSILEADTEVESFTHLLKRGINYGDINIFFGTLLKEGITPGNVLKFEKGNIGLYKDGNSFNNGPRKFLLYHFVLEKALLTFDYPRWKHVPEKYYISRYGFHKSTIFIPLEIMWSSLKILLIKYPNKVMFKIKKLYSGRIMIDEQTV